jgi:hypothetical protein
LTELMRKVLRDKVVVLDEAMLRLRLEESGVPYSRHRDALCLVWDMLRIGGNGIRAPEESGFRVLGQYGDLSLAELRERIDNDMYELSVAYYKRHVAIPTIVSAPPKQI